MNKTRILYFDVLKLIACFLVVYIHILSKFWKNIDITSLDFKIISILIVFAACSVPIFFMISGALFLNEDKKITIKTMYTKYIIRLFLIFVFWNIIYSLLTYIFISHVDVNISLILTILGDTLMGKGFYHLWFLPIIIGLYICTPIIKLITKKENKTLVEYLLLILLIFTGLNSVTGIFFNWNLYYPLSFTGYLFYFLAGYYINTFDISKIKEKLVYGAGILAFTISIIMILIYAPSLGHKTKDIFAYLNINMMIMSCSIFLLFKNTIKKINPILNKIINNVSNTFLGIYIIHGLVIALFIYIDFFNFSNDHIYMFPVYIIITFILSYMIAWLMKKIPGIRALIN